MDVVMERPHKAVSKALWMLMIAFATLFSTQAISDTIQQWPPAVVTGRATSGPDILCRGYACADMLEAWQRPSGIFLDQDVAISPDGDVAVDRDGFCSGLKGAKPSGCNAISGFVSPLFNSSWMPNGCGNNQLVRDFIDVAGSLLMPYEYSGNPDAPYRGISFLSACNDHDRCYAVGTSRSVCDMNFLTGMETACSVNSGGDRCSQVASAYGGVVSRLGGGPYAEAGRQKECDTWKADMHANGCPVS